MRPALESLERRLCLTVSVTDVTRREGNLGTTDFVFTVTYTGGITPGEPVGATAVTVDHSAKAQADDDYESKEAFLLFTSSARTRTFTVTVNADTKFESNEEFFVDVTADFGGSARGTGTIENDDADLPVLTGNVTVAGTAGPDTLIVNATGPDSGTFTLNGAAARTFAAVTSFTFDALAGDDLFQINNPVNDFFAPSQGVTYHAGGQSGDALEEHGGPSSGLGAHYGHSLNGWGTLTHGSFASSSQTIRFSGLAQVTDTVPGDFHVIARDTADTITLDNGPSGADGRVRFASDAFVPVSIGNKSTITVHADDGADTISLQSTESAGALTVDAGDGDDSVNIRSAPAGQFFTIKGEDGSDTFTFVYGPGTQIAGLFTLTGGGPERDQVIFDKRAETAPSTYQFTPTNIWGNVASQINYSQIENFTVHAGSGADNIEVFAGTTALITINANAGNDALRLTSGGTLSGGTFDGGPGTNTLTYIPPAVPSTPVAVNLGLGVTGLSATLGGDQELPARDTAASGTATVSNYNHIAKTFDITVTVNGIAPEQVRSFRIDRGPFGFNGPTIIDLMALGTLVPAGSGFTFTANGISLADSLLGGVANEAAFLGGLTYVNVLTAAHPGGEIRGQLFSTGNVPFTNGTATGTGGITNVQNVTVPIPAGSGSTADSLVGNFDSNTLRGGNGNDTLVGGPGNDTLAGEGNDDVLAWNNGDDADRIDGDAGTDVVQISGSAAAADAFSITASGTRIDLDPSSAASLDIGTVENLIVNGVGGNDTFTHNNLFTVQLGLLRLNGQDGDDLFDFAARPSGNFEYGIHGGPGSDTLAGPDVQTSFVFEGPNRGSFGSREDFQFVENLVGGSNNDTFLIASGTGLTGTIDGGGGTNTLQYSGYTTPVAVNLGLGTTGLAANLSADQEPSQAFRSMPVGGDSPRNPRPGAPTSTTASGMATISNYDPIAKSFDITVTVTNLPPSQVIGFHIRRGPVGVDGPIIFDLTSLAPLVPAGSGFTFTANRISLANSLLGGVANEAALLGGLTYINIHTPTYPEGEIRGQLFSTGNLPLTSGTATGTGGVTNIQSVTGGSAGDSLVGSFVANALRGDSGNDTLVGGPGAGDDTLVGEDDDDAFAWNDGDDTDIMDGGAGTGDVVQVNGAQGGAAADDTFAINRLGSGPWIDLDRLGTGPFSLFIGITENLIVNGLAGDDTFTVNTLAGVADLVLLRLGGFGGSDTFNITPAPTVNIDVNGHSPTPPAQPGDTLNVNTAATTAPQLDFTATPAGLHGVYSFDDRRRVLFTHIETGPTAPRVVATTFQNDTAPHFLRYTFSQDVSASLTAGDRHFRIENQSTGAVLFSDDIRLVQDPVTRTAVFTFPGLPRGILPDGNWRATLFGAGITGDLGVRLDGDAEQNPGGDHVFNFFHLTADANRDRSVGFADLVVVAQNYNSTNKTFSEGNFDYDPAGLVNFNDLVLLAQRYGTSLPPAGAAAAEPVAAKAQAQRPPVFNDTPIRPTTRPARRPQPSRKER